MLAFAAWHASESRRWVDRDELLALLWPERPEAKARAALRQMLHELGSTELGPTLDVEDSRLRWRGGSDVAAFRSLIRQRAWSEALDLERGPFLAGWRLPRADAADAWIAEVRGSLEDAKRAALAGRAAELEAEGSYGAAARIHGQLWRTDVLDEAALARQLFCLQQAGRQQRAATEARAYRDRIEDEFGDLPSGDVAELLATVARGETVDEPETTAPPPADASAEPVALPRRTAPLIGRDTELEAIEHRLATDAPITTLVGPGGIGKTRLALEVAHRTADAGRPIVAWIALETVASADESTDAAPDAASDLATALGAAVGAELDSQAPPHERALAALRGRRGLLVLDNLEHLLPDVAPLFASILSDVAELRILATSRRPVGLRSEATVDVGRLDRASSLRLLRAEAGRVGVELANGTPELDGLVDALDGHALAIQLAAAQLATANVATVRDRIERDPAALRAGWADAPERHRSLHAAFGATWEHLTDRERTAAAGLSLYRTAFDLGDARALWVDAPEVAGLARASVLERIGDGRWTFHPHLRRLVTSRAAHDRRDGVELAYAHRIATRIEDAWEAWHDGEAGPAFERIDAMLADTRAAWHILARAGDDRSVDALHRMSAALQTHAWRRGRIRDIDALFRHSLELDPPAALRRRLHSHLAELSIGLDDYAEADTLLDGLVEEATVAGEDDTALEARSTLGILRRRQGHPAEARALAEANAAHALRLGRPDFEAYQRLYVAASWMVEGDPARASDEARLAYERFLALGHADGIANSLSARASFVWERDPSRAIELWRRALELRRDLGDRPGIARTHRDLARAHLRLGHLDEAAEALDRAATLTLDLHGSLGPDLIYQQAGLAHASGDLGRAEALFERAAAEWTRIGIPRAVASARSALAEVAWARGDVEQALRQARTALASHHEAGSRAGEAFALVRIARIQLARGERAEARTSVGLAREIARELSFSTPSSLAGIVHARVLVAEDDARAARAALVDLHDEVRARTEAEAFLLPTYALAWAEVERRSRRAELAAALASAVVDDPRTDVWTKGEAHAFLEAEATTHDSAGSGAGTQGADPSGASHRTSLDALVASLGIGVD